MGAQRDDLAIEHVRLLLVAEGLERGNVEGHCLLVEGGGGEDPEVVNHRCGGLDWEVEGSESCVWTGGGLFDEGGDDSGPDPEHLE